MTSDRGQSWAERAPALYPRYPAGVAGLRSPSICLLDQTRSLGVERVSRCRGTLSEEEYEPVREGLGRILGVLKGIEDEPERREEEGEDDE